MDGLSLSPGVADHVTKALKVTIEAGSANHRSDNYFTTAYWYQDEPHVPFPALPPVADRIPRLKVTGGPEVIER